MNQTELEQALKQAQDAYYRGEPIMSDLEFDKLWDELEERFPDSILLREVGADHTNGFRNVKHTIIMGSQAKANTAEDMNKYFIRNGKGKYLAQYKLDGCLDYDTVLETDQGPMKIGYIVDNKIKCNVKAKDLNTGKIIYTPIKHYFINNNDYKWYKLTFSDGTTFVATGNHKIYLPELNCWRKVEDLVENDIIDKLQ